MRIPESDWKVFRKLHRVALERFCQRVLDESTAICAKNDATAHERYLELYALVQERNRRIADVFDEFRRSTALTSIRLMRVHDLLTADEIAEFSEETQRTTQVPR